MRIVSPDQSEESIKMAVNYIQERQTPDGGYFFACIPPGNLLDTFFAVGSLCLLGLQPARLTSLDKFISSFESDYTNGSIHAIYLAIGTLQAINKPIEPFRAFGKTALNHFRLAEVCKFDRLDIEVVSELKSIYEAITVFTNLNIQFDKKPVADLILSLLNTDGGFGRNKRSTLATTYYAIQALKLIRYQQNSSELTLEYLNKTEKDIYYIEDLYYLTMTRYTLGNRPSYLEKEKAISSVLSYQGAWGGFARSKIMGIQTLEYTYYAISLLNLLEAIPNQEKFRRLA